MNKIFRVIWVVFVTLLLLPSLLFGETYREWLDYPLKDKNLVSLEFVDINERLMIVEGEIVVPILRIDDHKDQCHTKNFICGSTLGEIRVLLNSVENHQYPVDVNLIYTDVNADTVPRPDGCGHFLDLDSELRNEFFVSSQKFLHSSEEKIIAIDTMFNDAPFMSLRIEVLDSLGSVLYRSLLIDSLYWGGNCYIGNAWITDASGYARFSENVKAAYIKILKQFPKRLASYMNTNALWLSDQQLLKDFFDVKNLRRLLLKGTWIYVPEQSYERVSKTVEKYSDSLILGSGLVPDNKASNQEYFTSIMWQSCHDAPFNFSINGVEKKIECLSNQFGRYRNKFIIFTVVLLGTYVFLLITVVPVAFYKLKGERRILIWLFVPLLSFGTCICIYGGYFLLLKNKPLVDIIETRFGYGNWDEIFVLDKVNILPVSKGTVKYSFKGEDIIGESLNNASSYIYRRNQITKNSQKGKIDYEYRAKDYGTTLEQKYEQFLSLDKPVQLYDPEKKIFKIMFDVEWLFLIDSNENRYFTNLKKGQEIGLSDGAKIEVNDVKQHSLAVFMHTPQRSYCDRNSTDVPVNNCPTQWPWSGSIIAIARTKEKGKIDISREDNFVRDQVTWILQMPLDARSKI